MGEKPDYAYRQIVNAWCMYDWGSSAFSTTVEFFGFYDVSSKFAGIAGPALFALAGQLTGTSRLSIVALILFFVGGISLLTLVDEQGGIRVAEEENRALGLA